MINSSIIIYRYLDEEKSQQTTYCCDNKGEFSLGGAKANSTHIGTELQKYFVVGDTANNVRLFTF